MILDEATFVEREDYFQTFEEVEDSLLHLSNSDIEAFKNKLKFSHEEHLRTIRPNFRKLESTKVIFKLENKEKDTLIYVAMKLLIICWIISYIHERWLHINMH